MMLHCIALHCIADTCTHTISISISVSAPIPIYISIYAYIYTYYMYNLSLHCVGITGSLERPAFTLRISAKIHSDVIKRLLHAPIATPPQPRFFLGLSQQKMELKDVKSTFKHHSTPEKWIRAGMTNTFEDLQSQQQRGSPQMRVSKP